MKVCLITGGASGLGLALFNALTDVLHKPQHGFDFENVYSLDVAHNDIDLLLNAAEVNVGRQSQWHKLMLELNANGDQVSCLINCCGVNSIDYLEDFREDEWDRLMDTNAKGIYLGTRNCLPHLTKTKGTVVNITSNASHMPMTSSLAYNASKAAAHMMTQQLARELTKRHGITVFGVAPNKMSGTGMSRYIETAVPRVRGWSEEEAKAYQESTLLSGETPPEAVAEFITFLLSSKARHQYLSGCILPYGI